MRNHMVQFLMEGVYSMKLFDKIVAKLTESYKGYETRTELENSVNYFVIANPFGGENIRVSDEDGKK